jgi:hypothetical protein
MKWLTEQRLHVYPRIIVALYALLAVFFVVAALWSGPGLTVYQGKPLGFDFSHYWLASSLALSGEQATVYEVPKFLKAQETRFHTTRSQLPWLYPPTFLLLILPLALLPYPASLALWLGVTLSGYVAVLRRIAPHPLTPWLALAFPGAYQNFFSGQNGFLSAIFLGGGLGLLTRRPILGGALLGLASYKPHLMVLVPVALAAGRQWRALLAALGAAALLAAASLLLWGPGVWLAFWKNAALPARLYDMGLLPVNKMVTVFAAALQLGASFSTALAIQGLVMIAVTALVFWVWRRGAPFPVCAAALVLGLLLFTPYAFPYDLALLALPLAWLGWEGYSRGWEPGEQILLFSGWVIPLAGPAFNLPVVPLALLALFLPVVRRAAATVNSTSA